MSKSGDILPFGKYKGRTVQEIAAIDKAYVEWLIQQPWFKEKFSVTFNVIVNQNIAPAVEDSPEHNALQARFLEEGYVAALFAPYLKEARFRADAGYSDDLNWAETRIRQDRRHPPRNEKGWPQPGAPQDQWREYAVVYENEPPASRLRYDCSFEVKGADVQIRIDRTIVHASIDVDHEAQRLTVEFSEGLEFGRREAMVELFRVECKPTVGEDYPAILRQMKRNETRWLVYERMNIESVSEQGVRAIFAASDITLIQSPPRLAPANLPKEGAP